jgi:site-specific DNA-methyltransferase (adenine-specific)
MAYLHWNNKWNRREETLQRLQTRLHITDCFPHSLKEAENELADPRSLQWHNRLIHGNTSVILPALLPEFSNSVDLIYIDPPFMTGKDFMNGNGTELAYSDKWNNDLDAYLQWLYEVLVLLHLLLAQHGSLYVHLDWRVVHYAKVMLDEVFGFNPAEDGPGFKSEIIWHYQSGGRSHKSYARKHDTILLYTKSAHSCFHAERIGERRGSEKRNHMRKQVDADGHVTWTIRSAGRLYSYDEDQPMTPADVWSDISHLHQQDPERNGYATQKPSALLERIILASSEERNLVLDCFCGSGVTPSVAEQLGRRWIACDQSPLAIRLTQERILAQTQVRPFIVQELR